MINWQLICSHMNQGGLGVCDLQAFNLTLLSKWWWRFFNDTNAPWVDLVMHNYYRRRRAHNLHITLTGHVSSFWIGVLKASTDFASGTHIVVGDGYPTRFWLDHWVRNDTLASLFPNLFALARDPSTTVKSQTRVLDGNTIWDPHFRRWPNLFLRANIYNELICLLTFLQPLHLSTLSDVRQWKLKQGGVFTINSLYRELTEFREENNCFW